MSSTMISVALLPFHIFYRFVTLPMTVVLFWLNSIERMLELLDKIIKLVTEQ